MDFPRFSTSPERVVVLGDTGCRIATGWYQNCSGSGTGTPWNFAEVATAVAVEKPDLIVHVGDFVYREAECDADAQPGCRGSPWGDKWDTWETDFFSPAAPLLRVAPWIVTRGNHEDCGRNHLGWLRFLDGRTLTDSDLTDEGCPLIPDPYKVGFEDLDVLVMDTSTSPSADLDPSPQERYADDFTQAAALVNQGRTTWSVTHRAFWGIFPDWRNPSVLEVADPILQAAISMMPNGGWPSEVKLALAGHIHLFEILSFPDSRPQQVISGGGGTARDAAITSEAIDGNPEVFAQLGITPDDFESYREFGYVLLERLPAGGWSLRVKELDGVQVEQFSLR
ncbi:metallophosphoesterase [Myxococcota bacterium]|nr:metallophosphoesterase [Myxococcota bacterium]